MVPVRKPGRPLSACPHNPDAPCNCGHITAAIPRKQTCRCPDEGDNVVSSPTVGGPYRVQKGSSRPQTSRGTSYFDPSGFERTNKDFFHDHGRNPNNMGGVNKAPWREVEATPWRPDRPSLHDYTSKVLKNKILPDGSPMPENFLGPDIPTTVTVINQRLYADGTVIFHGNGGKPLTLAEKVIGETKLGGPIPSPEELGDIYPRTDVHLDLANDDSYKLFMRDDLRIGTPQERKNAGLPPGLTRPYYPRDDYAPSSGVSAKSESKSCCANKKTTPNHSHNSSSASSISEPEDIKPTPGLDSTPRVAPQEFASSHNVIPQTFPEMLKQEPMTPYTGPQIYRSEMVPNPQMSINTQVQPYASSGLFHPVTMLDVFAPQASFPQDTSAMLFTYPPTYGSFQNPFKPETWRQNLQVTSNMPPLTGGNMPSAYFNMPVQQTNADDLHGCCCGDGCQCLGCAAHPYNATTQEYVRSAYSFDPSAANDFPMSPITASRNSVVPQQHSSGTSKDELSDSQAMLSPASSTNGDEQTLSESNYFFADYAIGGACGGETVTCPCGDDCECIGCTIHNYKPVGQAVEENTQNQSSTLGCSSCCS
jgi:hypothetical protein